jgi:hypothetical protein
LRWRIGPFFGIIGDGKLVGAGVVVDKHSSGAAVVTPGDAKRLPPQHVLGQVGVAKHWKADTAWIEGGQRDEKGACAMGGEWRGRVIVVL